VAEQDAPAREAQRASRRDEIGFLEGQHLAPRQPPAAHNLSLGIGHLPADQLTRLRIGYLPQELETITGKTVLDAAHRDEFPEHEAKRILMGLGFTEVDFTRPVENLSGGYRMRVALAHLLLSNPDVLMLDEPLAGMNLEEKEDMARFIIDIREAMDIPVVIVEHDMQVVMDIADRIYVLNWGNVIAEGPPLVRAPALPISMRKVI
jgi:ABC-type branched-subunit amino acid transport system ATPase component